MPTWIGFVQTLGSGTVTAGGGLGCGDGCGCAGAGWPDPCEGRCVGRVFTLRLVSGGVGD